MILFRPLLLLLLIPSMNLLHAGWLDRKAEGWAWYEDPELPDEQESQEITPPSPLGPTEQIEQAKQQLQTKLSLALLKPTDENVLDYLVAQRYWIEQSSKFSKSWARMLLQNPGLDATIEHPVSQYGVRLHKEMAQERKETLIKELVQDHGLFFFYEGKTRVSQAFAFVVQQFAKKYRWDVVALTVDGNAIDLFSDGADGHRLAMKLGVEVFPALYLVNTKTDQALPIAFGLASIDQIEQNISLQLSVSKEDSHE